MRNKRDDGGGWCLGPMCPLMSSQKVEVPLLRHAKVKVTAPNLGPSGLFLPIRPFSPVSRPSSDTNHSSWLAEQMTAQVCPGRPKFSCAFNYRQTERDPRCVSAFF